MTPADFQARLSRLEPTGSRRGMDAVMDAGTTPDFRPDDRKIRRAIELLHDAGITGNEAYAPGFQALAQIGLAVRPLHFWAPTMMWLFAFLLFSGVFSLTLTLCLHFGSVPPAIVAAIAFGPREFLPLMGMMASAFTIVTWLQARRANLPDWANV